mmetsp:Transcript_33586/g.89756  ORF Transcript_33586/g.89756 Transcript_33586/m.89756 type:complete len:109 (-) Transcript_33586:294-620(-)
MHADEFVIHCPLTIQNVRLVRCCRRAFWSGLSNGISFCIFDVAHARGAQRECVRSDALVVATGISFCVFNVSPARGACVRSEEKRSGELSHSTENGTSPGRKCGVGGI